MPDVVLTYLHPSREISTSFFKSLQALVGYDRSRGAGEWRLDHWNAITCGSGGLVEARNKSVRDFLDQPGAAEWLFIVDSDMGFAADALDHLLSVADADERPIVGGLCFAFKETHPDGYGGFRCEPRPTIFDWVKVGDEAPKFMGRRTYPVNELTQCAATGAAFVLVHRGVLEAMADEHGDNWFTRVPGSDGSLLGEDVSFCLRAGALDVPIFVHTGVRTTHTKTVWVGEQDYWSSITVPPAADETAVIVPVLHRPEHAEPFMRSLRASTGLATAYAVVQEDDHAAAIAWRSAGAFVITVPDDVVSFAQKVNVGYERSVEPWMFVVGSDVRFRPGWLDHAQHVGETFGAGIVGTNDLGNPAVMAGQHATHFLVRRTYVDELGASWDGPGVLCHEGYRHWYVDNEIVLAARQRGVWAMAIGSIVEHLHSAWGKAANDDVYELGQAASEVDKELFRQRFDESRSVRAA